MSATATAPAESRPLSGPAGGSISELVSGILDDGQKLFKQQIEMVKSEVKEDLRKTQNMVVYLGVAIGLAAVGAVMALVALVYLIKRLTEWELDACWGVVAGVTLAAAAIAFVIGGRILASYNPLPDKSFNALQENVACLTTTPK